jgi:cob(I)alamin adenosyltransferase
MTNWQFITIVGAFILSFFGFILTLLGTARTQQVALNEQFTNFRVALNEQLTSFRNEMKAELASVKNELKSEIETLRNEIRQNDKRYEERFARLEADIRDIKNDLRQVFKPVLPGG